MSAHLTTGAGPLIPSTGRNKPGHWLSRLFGNFGKGREDRGHRIAYVHLARLSDQALLALGHKRAQIAEIRKVADKGIMSY